MDKNKTSMLSALLDGELEAHQAPNLFAALRREEELRRHWAEYVLIGDALRGEGGSQSDITASVMTKVRLQPVVLAPRPLPVKPMPALLALAASLAGVAVVGWLVFAPSVDEGLRLAKVSSTSAPSTKPEVRDMREYLLAHHAQVSPLLPQGATQHIRTVAVHLPAGSR